MGHNTPMWPDVHIKENKKEGGWSFTSLEGTFLYTSLREVFKAHSGFICYWEEEAE